MKLIIIGATKRVHAVMMKNVRYKTLIEIIHCDNIMINERKQIPYSCLARFNTRRRVVK